MTKTVAGHEYQIGRLDAFKQFHVVRRLGPLLMHMGIASMLGRQEKGAQDSLPEAVQAAVRDLAKLPDDDANYILLTCLSVVKRKRAIDDGWDAVTAPNGMLMFPNEMDLAAMLQLVWFVIEDNLSNFWAALPSTSSLPGGAPSNLSTFLGRKTGS